MILKDNAVVQILGIFILKETSVFSTQSELLFNGILVLLKIDK